MLTCEHASFSNKYIFIKIIIFFLGEMAMILPGALSHSRHSNDTVDIRKNLRLRNPDDPESNTHKELVVVLNTFSKD